MSKGPTASVLKTSLGSITQAFTYQTARRTSCKVWGCSMCTLSGLSRYSRQRRAQRTPASDQKCFGVVESRYASLKPGALWSPTTFTVRGKQLSKLYTWLPGCCTASLDVCFKQAPARKVPSEGDNNDNQTIFPSATVQMDQKQHTMHAVETLLPHKQATHLGAHATSTGKPSPSPHDLQAATTATNKCIRTFQSLNTLIWLLQAL